MLTLEISSTEPARRRRRILTRGVPLLAIAIAAFAVGITVGKPSAQRAAVERFVRAWEARDYAAMYDEVSPASQSSYPLADFSRTYKRTNRAAAIKEISGGELIEGSTDGVIDVNIVYETNVFGRLGGSIPLPVTGSTIDWAPHLVFPTLVEGERVERRGGSAPRRAPILAVDGSDLASGPARSSSLGAAALPITGVLGPADGDTKASLIERGFAADTPVGTNGLELAFDTELAGIPGGTLVAANPDSEELRTLASHDPEPGRPLRTTIDPTIQSAAVTALGDQFGGVAVLDAQTGDVRALAGLAFSAPQPPGSTFKIITVAAALEEGLTSPEEQFPVLVSIDAGGRELSNAHEEACGGTLQRSFVLSCNTVFGPLGVKLGADRLVDYAKAFGFNEPPSLYNDEALGRVGPAESMIPDPIDGSVEVGVTAIGQGRVLATPLLVASWAQTIAADGLRQPTNMVENRGLRSDFEGERAVSRGVAAQVQAMMLETVKTGTGQNAAVDSVQVAGKTGTAELREKPPEPLEPGEKPPDPDEPPEFEVDAWFAAYAPAARPEIAVAVMVVNADGDGGDIAAPIARQIFEILYGP